MNGTRRRRSYLAAAAAGASLALVLTACSSDDDGGGGGDDATSARPTARRTSSTATSRARRSASTRRSSSPSRSSRPTRTSRSRSAPAPTIEYEGSREFEAQLPVRLQAGNPPDIAYIPQPGLLQSIVARLPRRRRPGPAGGHRQRRRVLHRGAGSDYGTVDGTFYATPLGANVKSFVWYSPAMFADERLRDPHDVGRADRPLRPDRRRPARRQAVVRGHRVR